MRKKKPALNLDLETAERLVIAAGHPELAEALTFQAHGVRNLVQGEWGKSFIKSLDDLLGKHIEPLMKAQKETQDGVAALGAQFQTLAESVEQLEKDTAALKAGQVAYNGRLDEMDRRHEGQIREMVERLDHKRHELDEIHEWQRMIHEWRQMIDARAAAYPEEDIRKIVDYVRRKMAEEQAGDAER